MDDKIEQFRAVTNSSLETAIRLLEACDGNLEAAIDFFLQQGEIDGNDAAGPSSNGASASVGGFGDLTPEDLVRAPIASRSGVLVEESFQRSYAPTRKPRQANSVFSKFRDFEAETKAKEQKLFGSKTNKGAAVETKRKTLETLFRPPLEIMHRGTFETAKAAAVSSGFWLIVNVQQIDEFACQALNRDVWNNSAVQDLIQSNFILWQIYSDSADGQRFQAYYRVPTHPFVCILDPRTGELLQTLKTNDAAVFCEEVSTFLEQNPTFSAHDSNCAINPPNYAEESISSAAIPKNQLVQSQPLASTTIGKRGSGKRRLIQNGTADHGAIKNGNHDMEEVEEPKPKMVRMEDEDSSTGVSTASATSFPAKAGTGDNQHQQKIEGTLMPFGTPDMRLMFRLPDGSKRYLTTPKYATVQEVLTYAEKEWHLLPSTHDFVMNYPTRRLNKEIGSRTLEALGIQKQDVIYVEEN